MSDPSSERDPVETLATDFLDRIRRGEHPSVEEYATKHPALAEAIRGLFPTIARMERLKLGRERSSGDAATMGGPRPETLGDFRILQEVGRGGMGIVYEAEQQSLGRRVAVKVLPRSSLQNARLLQRFRREAQTAAGLHHTNIVPVFGVGEEGDYHYIVMQLIAGVGLDEVLLRLGESGRLKSRETDGLAASPGSGSTKRLAEAADAARMLVDSNIEHVEEQGSSVSGGRAAGPAAGKPRALLAEAPTDDFRPETTPAVMVRPDPPLPGKGLSADLTNLLRIGPTYWRNVARVGSQVADALSHAHERDVLHRDIKPSNLIIDRHGIAWVTDFGLAKAMQDDSVSHTGDIVGTLRYMAPERFRGEADARSDVYGLGLTLYEMLALRPAYEASDASSLMRKISEEPPRRLAAVAAGIPRDLETIVMKAVAREPAHRYQSAEEMADDLRRFLGDRPIRARRVSSVEHLWRWCRRNPTVAGLTATALALLVLVAVVASVGYILTNEALDTASVQQRKADATSDLALEALDDIFEQFAPDRISTSADIPLDDASGSSIQATVQPVLSKEAASLLERLLVFYDRLAAHGGGDAEFRRKSADANRRVGDIRAALGQFELAQAAYLTAVETYRQIEEHDPSDGSIAVEIARIYNSLGQLQIPAGSPAESQPFHLKALETLDQVTQTTDASPALRYEMARTCYSLGQSGRPPDMMFGTPPPPPDHPWDLQHGGPYDMRPDAPPFDDPFWERPPGGPGPPLGGPGPPPSQPRHDENEQYLQRAIGLLEGLAEEQPTIPDYQHLLACCYRDLPPAMPFDAGGSQPEQINRAIEILEKLVERFPTVPAYRHDLAKSYLQASLQFEAGALSTAENRLQEALRVTRNLVAEHPNEPGYVLSQVQVHLALSEMAQRGTRPKAAEQELRKALSLQSSLVSRFPGVVPYKVWIARIQNILAELLMDQGQMEEACFLLIRTTATLLAILDTDREAGHIMRLLEQSYENLAEAYMQLGQEDLANEALGEAEQLRDYGGGPPHFSPE
jgi:eukaryotic-like serine/threonine-protein kinase